MQTQAPAPFVTARQASEHGHEHGAVSERRREKGGHTCNAIGCPVPSLSLASQIARVFGRSVEDVFEYGEGN